MIRTSLRSSMPDHDSMLGQNEVDVLNEARNPLNAMPIRHAKIDGAIDTELADAVEHLRRLNETTAINADAEQRRQESIIRTLDEIQRLMDG